MTTKEMIEITLPLLPKKAAGVLKERINPRFIKCDDKDAFSSPADLIIDGFLWGDTPEGLFFWRNIYNSLLNEGTANGSSI